MPPDLLPDFETFWQAYPRKVGKGAARKAWLQLQPSSETLQLMLIALHWQTVQPQWLKDGGQYVPNPATYLHQERWLDEPMEQPQWTAKTTHSVTAVKRWLQH